MNATATRRQMIQGAAMLGSVAALGTMAGSAPAQAAEAPTTGWTAGTYQATKPGRRGDVTVEVELSDDAIVSVAVVKEEETRPIATSALAHVPAAIVDGQTLNVETISGSTFTCNAIVDAVASCLEQAGADPQALFDAPQAPAAKAMAAGTYTQTVHGHHSDVVVEVVLGADAIEGVTILEEGETFNLADGALTQVPAAIVEAQSTGVDTVTGATYTSRAVMTAVEQAITEAGGEEAYRAFATRVASEPWSTEEKTVDADVVVVGSGMTGIAAALSAQDAGAGKVVIVEKLPFFGGVSQTCLGYYRAPYENSPEAIDNFIFYNRHMWMGSMQDETIDDQYPYPEWTEKFANTIFPALEFIEGHGAPLFYDKDHCINGRPDLRCQYPYYSVEGLDSPDIVGTSFAQYLEEFKERGGEVYLECPVTELITDGSGAVVGCKAEGRDGHYTFNAKAVVLAAGGYGANPAAIAEYAPAYNGEENVTLVGNVGDGIAMGREVGGAIYDDGMFMGQSGVSLMTDYEMVHPYTDSVFPKTGIYVNQQGLRINSETPEPYTGGSTYVNADTKDYYWAIINAEEASHSSDHLEGNVNTAAITSDTQFIDVCEEQLALGNERYFKADTLADLAKQIHIVPNTLRYTLNRYNGFCEQGEDADYFKDPYHLHTMPQDSGPWYAVKCYMLYFGTIGGLKTNTDTAVLTESGEVIPGLFAGGETANHAVFNLSYLGAISMTYCLVSGYLAGQSAAAVAQA